MHYSSRTYARYFIPFDGNFNVKVKVPRDLMRYIVPKGFIAVDGTSLTVCEVDNEDCWFTFMLVAYTQVCGSPMDGPASTTVNICSAVVSNTAVGLISAIRTILYSVFIASQP